MNRRNFIKIISSMPFFGFLKLEKSKETFEVIFPDGKSFPKTECKITKSDYGFSVSCKIDHSYEASLTKLVNNTLCNSVYYRQPGQFTLNGKEKVVGQITEYVINYPSLVTFKVATKESNLEFKPSLKLAS